MSDRSHRKLAAIVAADVAGYSRLMGVDEEGTLAALKAHRNAIDPVIFSHGGRIVKTTGDGLLIEFPTVVAAVRSALQVQRIMAERAALLPADRRMQFRIGVHVGEVIAEQDDLFGDTVNVTARLQELAAPGGIALSGAARDAVYRQIEVPLLDLGRQPLKNIAEPVPVWRVEMGETEQAGLVAAAARAPRERSAVAVLPFDNMSANPAQEYFADGLAEDLITALPRIRELKVIARNSSFAYRGKARDVKLIAAELDARYVLEGSVRKAGPRVRVTAQLIDAMGGQHIWAERYDRDRTDIFALQDEPTSNIASRVAPTVRHHEIEAARKRTPRDLDTWDLYLRHAVPLQPAHPGGLRRRARPLPRDHRARRGLRPRLLLLRATDLLRRTAALREPHAGALAGDAAPGGARRRPGARRRRCAGRAFDGLCVLGPSCGGVAACP